MSINWKEIHNELAAATAVIDRGAARSPGETRNILQARAQALARESASGDTDGESIEVLEFRLAYESYGIESSSVREVYPLKAFTPLPGTPAFVFGIVNVRGRIFSVIDLKKFFELPEKGLSDLNKVIIAQYQDIELGILADAVVGIRSIPVADIQPSLPTLTGIRQDYLKGVTRERLVVLDAGKLLSDRSLIVHEQAGS